MSEKEREGKACMESRTLPTENGEIGMQNMFFLYYKHKYYFSSQLATILASYSGKTHTNFFFFHYFSFTHEKKLRKVMKEKEIWWDFPK